MDGGLAGGETQTGGSQIIYALKFYDTKELSGYPAHCHALIQHIRHMQAEAGTSSGTTHREQEGKVYEKALSRK